MTYAAVCEKNESKRPDGRHDMRTFWFSLTFDLALQTKLFT